MAPGIRNSSIDVFDLHVYSAQRWYVSPSISTLADSQERQVISTDANRTSALHHGRLGALRVDWLLGIGALASGHSTGGRTQRDVEAIGWKRNSDRFINSWNPGGNHVIT